MVGDLHPPYALNWNLTSELQLSTNNVVRLTYQGSTGVGLIESWNVNVFPTSFGSDNPTLRNAAFAATQNYLPYKQFGKINQMANSGHSSYHSATVQFEKRMSHGLVLNSFYTFSKAIDQCDSDSGVCTGVAPVENRRLNKARAGFDQTQRFVTSVDYQLPFGANRRFLNRKGILNALVSGFALSWVQTIATGSPMSFGFSNSPNNYYSTAIGNWAPNRVCNPLRGAEFGLGKIIGGNRFNQALEGAAVNVNCFAAPAAFTPGNAGRNIMNAPGAYFSNISARKTFKVHEKFNAQVRMDFQNAFHNFGFGNPSTALDFRNPNLFGKISSDATTTFLVGRPLMMATMQVSW